MKCVRTILSDRIPKDLKENLRWKRRLHQRILKDPGFADAIKEACRLDPIFFVNAFGWTYDPRNKPFTRVPFILYDFQEEALLEIINAIGDHDLLIEKSRDMGASWVCITAFFWRFLFSRTKESFLMGSRVESYVDDSGNPKSLFWKIDFLLSNLPPWLRPAGYKESLHRRKLHIENPENAGVIDGESTNANFARGDRRTAILLDEFAAVELGERILQASRDATNCRIFNSTPIGVGNAFYDVRQTKIKKLRLHWSSHPLKSAGMYMSDHEGNLNVISKKGYPESYKPTLDGKLRSPWYDNQCERAANAREIAQEIDIDYLGSGHQFFDSEKVNKAIRAFACAPMLCGLLDFDVKTSEPTEFRESEEGSLRLWFLLNSKGEPQNDHRSAIGVDVSAGTGSSNSALCVWDQVTHEKLAEFVSPYIRPEQLAKQAVALAKWFDNAILIWESNGPGRQFGSRVLELGYTRFHLRRREEALSKKVTDIPGWAPTKEGKLILLGAYRDAIEKGHCVNRSKISLEETLEYVYSPSGGVVHSRAANKSDPSGAGASHGDRVIADALAWKAVTDRKISGNIDKPKAPLGSLAWRNEQRAKDTVVSSKELGEGW